MCDDSNVNVRKLLENVKGSSKKKKEKEFH